MSFAQLSHREGRVIEGTDPNREIDPLVDEIDTSIGEHDFDARLRVALEELRDDRCQKPATVEYGGRYAQEPNGLCLPLLNL